MLIRMDEESESNAPTVPRHERGEIYRAFIAVFFTSRGAGALQQIRHTRLVEHGFSAFAVRTAAAAGAAVDRLRIGVAGCQNYAAG